MKSVIQSLIAMQRRWNEFWFTPSDAATLGLIRICLGLCLLWSYAGGISALDYIGPDGWISSTASQKIDELEVAAMGGTYHPSLWKYLASESAAWWTFLGFLAAIICFTIGLASRGSNLIVLLGHLSFAHRCPMTIYGFDLVLAPLLLYLLFGPSGNDYSVDRWLARKRVLFWRNSPRYAETWNATFATRLIQVHMCIIYFCSGMAKLQGANWWDGTAIWYAIAVPEMWAFDLSGILMRFPLAVEIGSLLGTLMTLGFEIGFPFLIWNPRFRPLMLLTAVILHLGIGVMMGLYGFSAVMLTGCFSFVSPATTRRLVGRPASSVVVGLDNAS